MPELKVIGNRPRHLTIDINHDPRPPETMTYLASEAGSWYSVQSVRRVRSTVHPNRWRFTVLKIEEPDCFEPEDRTLVFHWYSRARRP